MQLTLDHGKNRRAITGAREGFARRRAMLGPVAATASLIAGVTAARADAATPTCSGVKATIVGTAGRDTRSSAPRGET